MIDIIEIENLISLKQEGAFWDFKKEWYKKNKDDKIPDLLHDIICFANNLVNRDCYIIIGVDEETDYSLVDVSHDINRKNTQKIVEFLKDKKFAGGIRPVVSVETVSISGCKIDIIVIKNSFETPYYLTDKYQSVNSFNIYTRVMDTNTPKDRSADINHVELLWKKRFRMLETPYEKLFCYLKNAEDWESSPIEYEDGKYYKYAPEFRMLTEKDESRDGYEFYLFTQTDPRPHWYVTTIYYHQTALETFQEMAMDGGRWSAIPPERSGIYDKASHSLSPYAWYSYYIEGSLRFIMHQFLRGYEKEPYEYKKYMDVIIVFGSEEQRKEFERYVEEHIVEFKTLVSEQKEPYMEAIPNYDMQHFSNQYKQALALKKLYEDFNRHHCFN